MEAIKHIITSKDCLQYNIEGDKAHVLWLNEDSGKVYREGTFDIVEKGKKRWIIIPSESGGGANTQIPLP